MSHLRSMTGPVSAGDGGGTEMQVLDAPPDECLRCGYNLRTIASDQPCPECGLMAERSRRVTDELHDTRPRWLRSLARGVWLILLAIATGVAWPFVLEWLEPWRWWAFGRAPWYASQLAWLGLDLAAVLLLCGVVLLTVREGYPPADRDDAGLRLLVRLAACMPMLALLLAQYRSWVQYRNPWVGNDGRETWELLIVLIATVGSAPLPLLLCLRLRGLAKRARSAHLAEHCLITGIGASAAVLYLAAAYVVLTNGNRWFGQYWIERSNAAIVVMLVMGTASALFLLWMIYLLIRFAIAFALAGRALRRKWASQDRAADAEVRSSPFPQLRDG